MVFFLTLSLSLWPLFITDDTFFSPIEHQHNLLTASVADQGESKQLPSPSREEGPRGTRLRLQQYASSSGSLLCTTALRSETPAEERTRFRILAASEDSEQLRIASAVLIACSHSDNTPWGPWRLDTTSNTTPLHARIVTFCSLTLRPGPWRPLVWGVQHLLRMALCSGETSIRQESLTTWLTRP